MVEARFQTSRQYPPDAQGLATIAPSDADGWENVNEALEYSSLVELIRDDNDGGLRALSMEFYRDPNVDDSGI